jgi:predicted O-methyltransferase YrrM
LACQARLAQLSLQSPIPTVKWSELFGRLQREGAPCALHVLPVSPGGGSTSWVETVFLSALVKLVEPRVILEIGAFQGRTTWHLFHNAPEDAEVYAVDLPDSLVPADITDISLAQSKSRPFLPASDRLTLILVDSRRWEAKLPRKVQFAFIDASHRYEDVKNDTEKVFANLDEDSCVCWHDCLWKDDSYGVHRYLRELLDKGYELHRLVSAYELSSIAFWLSPQCARRVGFHSEPGRGA